LITEQFYEVLTAEKKLKFLDTVQKLESFGKKSFKYIQFNNPEPTNKKIEGRSKIFNYLIQGTYFMKPSMKRLFIAKPDSKA
jgi:hypothetical protein